MLWLTDRPRLRTGVSLALLGAALVVLGLDGQHLRTALAAERDGVPAVVARTDIAPGTALGPDTVEVRAVAASALPADALRPEEHAGLVAADMVAAGQVLARNDAAPAGLRAGLARVGVPLPDHLPLAIGDRVAVVGADGAALATRAEVVAVDGSLVLELPEADARAVAAALAGYSTVTVVQVP